LKSFDGLDAVTEFEMGVIRFDAQFGAALVRHVHGVLDARGVLTTLLHYALMNPLSAPLWNRMGYRPLWTGWEVRPAASLR
jgi:hypothetical protein